MEAREQSQGRGYTKAPGRRCPAAGPAKGHVREVGILSTLPCRVTLGSSLSVPLLMQDCTVQSMSVRHRDS